MLFRCLLLVFSLGSILAPGCISAENVGGVTGVTFSVQATQSIEVRNIGEIICKSNIPYVVYVSALDKQTLKSSFVVSTDENQIILNGKSRFVGRNTWIAKSSQNTEDYGVKISIDYAIENPVVVYTILPN